MKKFLILLMLFIPMWTLAAPANFTLGKEYATVELATQPLAELEIPKHKILVVEFFNYGCPWCFHLEPLLEEWLKQNGNSIKFMRVPVVYETDWEIYSRAYYTAAALGKLNQITAAIFAAIHQQGANLASAEKMQQFFVSQGISVTDFKNVYDSSPSINAEMQQANNLMLTYKVFQIPCFIIDGKYITNAAMVKGDNQLLMQVVDYLVNKAKTEKH